MSEPTPNDPRKITLEDLLRLKRHERPGREYWVRFDRELNEKVWRTLVQPANSRSTHRLGWLVRVMGWMTAGAVSIIAAILAWPGYAVVSQTATPVAASLSSPASHMVSTPGIFTSDGSSSVASAAFPASGDFSAPAQPTYAVEDLSTSASPAGHNKIPATMSFAAERKDGERYAADAVNSSLFSTRWRGSAY